jgi:uracil-DNA glycosylase
MAKARKKIVYSDILERIKGVSPAYFKSVLEETPLSLIPEDPTEFLNWVKEGMSTCQKCILSDTRNNVTLPEGKYGAKIMIVGSASTIYDDLTGFPFTGTTQLKTSNCNHCKKTDKCFENRIIYDADQRTRWPKELICNYQASDIQKLNMDFFIKSPGAILTGAIREAFGYHLPRQSEIDFQWVKEKNLPLDYLTGNKNVCDTPPSAWYITNIVNCRSFDKTRNFDQEPINAQRVSCQPWLMKQWAAVNPVITVVLGRFPLMFYVGGKEKAGAVVPGQIFDTKLGPVIFENHPSEYLRSKHEVYKGYGYAKLVNSLTKAVEFVYENSSSS